MVSPASVTIAFCIFFAFLGSVYGQGTRLPENAISSRLENGTLKFGVAKGFHFNESAPNRITIGALKLKPSAIGKLEISFALPAKEKGGQVSLYICDDALTFCEPRNLAFSAQGTIVASTVTQMSAAASSKAKAKIGAHGFIEDDFEAALAMAKKNRQLVFVDVSASWCPACLRLEKEVFPTAAFAKIARDFVKLRLDADRLEHGFLKKKFTVRAIPTIIILDAEGEEISRVLDYQPLQILEAFLKSATLHPESFAKLMKKSDTGDLAAAAVLAERLFDSGRYEESTAQFDKLKMPPPRAIEARILSEKKLFASDAGRRPKFQKILREAIANESASTRSLRWRTLLLTTFDEKDAASAEEKKKVFSNGVALIEDLIAHPAKQKAALINEDIGEFTDFEPLMIAMYRVDLADEGKMTATDIAQAWSFAIEVGNKLAIPPTRLGPATRFLGLLGAAKRYSEAETLARAILKHDPKNFQVERTLSRILNSQAKFAEAEKHASASLKRSFGRNEFWAAEQLAKAYIGQKRHEKARPLIEKYLQRDEIAWPDMKSERERFETLRASLGK